MKRKSGGKTKSGSSLLHSPPVCVYIHTQKVKANLCALLYIFICAPLFYNVTKLYFLYFITTSTVYHVTSRFFSHARVFLFHLLLTRVPSTYLSPGSHYSQSFTQLTGQRVKQRPSTCIRCFYKIIQSTFIDQHQ